MIKKDMKKKGRKVSKNYLVCAITGAKRMSNYKYIMNKCKVNDTLEGDFKRHYVCKDAWKELVEFCSEFGFKVATQHYGIDYDTLSGYLRYNGRGAFEKIATALEKEVEDYQLMKKAA